MGRFLIDIYPMSPFTSIREEQGLNMEACTPSITQEKLGVEQTHFIGQYPPSVTKLYDTSVLSQ
jgi:hypothetical protein